MDMEELNSMEFHKEKEGDGCPDCLNGKLVERCGRTAESVPFLGCSNYPRCEFTTNFD